MKTLSLFLFFVLALMACEQRQGPVELTVKDYVQALKNEKMHNIRAEPNKKMITQMSAAYAADIYVGNQHVILLQAPAGKDAKLYGGVFQGYKAQGWSEHSNANLYLLAEPDTQRELIDVFMALKW